MKEYVCPILFHQAPYMFSAAIPEISQSSAGELVGADSKMRRNCVLIRTVKSVANVRIRTIAAFKSSFRKGRSDMGHGRFDALPADTVHCFQVGKHIPKTAAATQFDPVNSQCFNCNKGRKECEKLNAAKEETKH